MIKKLLLTIFFITIFTQAAFSEDIFRVTSVNFDTSNSLIFITSPDNTTEAIMKKIKLMKLQNPKRVYFDIDSAVLATESQNWFLSSDGVKQVKIGQFSTNPNKVRVVLYLDEDFNQSNISFLRVNNNIVIKFKEEIYKEGYFQNTYRDEKTFSSDFYENLSISNEEIDKLKAQINLAKKNEVLDQIQQAFSPRTSPLPEVTPSLPSKTTNIIKKELKLKSKYYLNLISPKTNGFLISGFGAACLEKPMYLTNPDRVVFDIPNAVINPEVGNQEFKIGQDTVRIGQFEQNKARVVINSTELEKYLPIFSADGQSILFVDSKAVDLLALFTRTNNVVSYYVKKINPLTDEFIIAFNSPVVHSITRDNSKLIINFYNTLRFNEQTFKDAINQTNLADMEIDLLPKIGLKLTLPLEENDIVNCFLGADGRSVKVALKRTLPKKSFYSSEKSIFLPKCKIKKSVVLDAGHGGSDYGAIRCGINEKDLNLDIARRVQALLLREGIAVAMTRNSDETLFLQDRTIFTANICPDIFISIHVNSCSKPEISGIETHYYHQKSLELAQTIHSNLISYVNANDRGLFKSKFYVINHTDVPAILVEVGFLSNAFERAELVSEQRKQQTARAIADGILKYLNRR